MFDAIKKFIKDTRTSWRVAEFERGYQQCQEMLGKGAFIYGIATDLEAIKLAGETTSYEIGMAHALNSTEALPSDPQERHDAIVEELRRNGF